MGKLRKPETKKLIGIIANEKNIFQWNSIHYCLGYYAQKLLTVEGRLNNRTKIESLQYILGLSYEQATRLFRAEDINTGMSHFSHFDWHYSEGISGDRQKALEVLKGLLAG